MPVNYKECPVCMGINPNIRADPDIIFPASNDVTDLLDAMESAFAADDAARKTETEFCHLCHDKGYICEDVSS